MAACFSGKGGEILNDEKKGLSLMTEGVIWKKLIGFAVPVFCCSVFQQLYSTVDAVIVGRFVGTEGLAAIGVTGQIIMLAVSIGLGLMMGISTAVSEYCGEGRWDKVRQVVVISIFVVIATWILKLITGLFLAEPILRAVNTPPEVLASAVLYLKIVFVGGLFTYAYSMCIFIMRACGDGSRPLFFLAFSCICNIVLDLLFVKGLSMGVAGAAIGTVIAESLAVLMCLVYMKKKMPMLWVSREDFRNTKKSRVAYVLKLSVPTSLQVSIVSLVAIFVQAVINEYGAVVVAGYAAAQKIEQIVIMFVNALSGALNTFTAQNRGAARFDRIKEGRHITVLISVGFMAVMTVFVFFAGKPLLGIFVDDANSAAVVEEGYLYLKITCGFYIILGLWQAYMAVLRGMADVLMPLVIGGIQILANLSAIWVLEPLFGKGGIWLAVGVSWSLCFLAALVRMRKYRLEKG